MKTLSQQKKSKKVSMSKPLKSNDLMEKRINPLTNKEEIKLQPDGLPAIWTSANDYCERCEVY